MLTFRVTEAEYLMLTNASRAAGSTDAETIRAALAVYFG